MIDQDMKKLEELAQKMESDDIPLDESLKVFNEGVSLIRKCHKKLEEAELRVQEILADNSSESGFTEKDVD